MTFDLARYQERSGKIDLDGIEWDRIPDSPLSTRDVAALEYMMDIEGHTSIYLSELLVSRASLEPEITGFLHVWAYEEMFHSLALARFLRAYGVDVPEGRAAALRRTDNRGRITTTLTVLAGSHLFDFFPAFYLTLGAINEMTTLWGYQRLVEVTGHPVLGDLLARIVKQERQHYAFYRHAAERRLQASGRTRRWTRWLLERSYGAVGEGVKSWEEIDAVVLHLFGDERGRRVVRRIDAEIGRLPGMERCRLVERTLDRAERRRGVPSTASLARESAADLGAANDEITGRTELLARPLRLERVRRSA